MSVVDEGTERHRRLEEMSGLMRVLQCHKDCHCCKPRISTGTVCVGCKEPTQIANGSPSQRCSGVHSCSRRGCMPSSRYQTRGGLLPRREMSPDRLSGRASRLLHGMERVLCPTGFSGDILRGAFYLTTALPTTVLLFLESSIKSL